MTCCTAARASPTQELADIFAAWNTRELRSYLIEITAKILARMDEETGKSLVDVILDEAAQKGTGKWTSQTALDTGAAIPTINAAVESRLISALKAERVVAAKVLGSAGKFTGDKASAGRRGRTGAVCQQDHFLCPGAQPVENGFPGI